MNNYCIGLRFINGGIDVYVFRLLFYSEQSKVWLQEVIAVEEGESNLVKMTRPATIEVKKSYSLLEESDGIYLSSGGGGAYLVFNKDNWYEQLTYKEVYLLILNKAKEKGLYE